MHDTDREELAQQVVAQLGARTIATAESCTAGRVVASLAAVEHAARFLRGGVVAYQDSVKRELLSVSAASVLTAEAAVEMAAGVARVLDADVSVATTGVAGDEPIEGTPPGTVYIATYVGGRTRAREHHFHGSPSEVCDRASDRALRDLLDDLDGDAPATADRSAGRTSVGDT